MTASLPLDDPAWPPEVPDAPHRPASVRKGRVRRNRYRKPGPIANTTGLIVPKTQPAPPGAPSNPPGGAETPAEESWWASWGGVVHAVLDVAGMVPVIGEVADLANAAIYAAEGDYVNASLSAAAAIPFAGWAATGAKAGIRATQAVGKRVATKGGAKATGKAGQHTLPPAPTPSKSGGAQASGGTVKGKEKGQPGDGKTNYPCPCQVP